jgi:hypothetical protein
MIGDFLYGRMLTDIYFLSAKHDVVPDVIIVITSFFACYPSQCYRHATLMYLN